MQYSNRYHLVTDIGRWLLLSLLFFISVQTHAYEVKIQFLDIYNQPIENLTVKAGGKSGSFDGSQYVIKGLVEGSHTLTIANAEYQSFSADFKVSANHKVHNFGQNKIIKSTDGYAIEGKVVDIDNKALADVNVAVDDKIVKTDNEGRFTLTVSSAQSYTVTFSKSNYLTVTKNYSVSDSNPLTNAGNIRIITGYEITGKVVDIDGKAVSGVSVSASDKNSQTDSEGQFSLSFSKSGSYQLTFSKSGYINTSRSVSVNDSYPRRSAGSVKIITGYSIGGTLIDEKGNTVSGVTVKADGKTVTSDSKGQFSIAVSESKTYTVTFSKTGYLDLSRNFSVSYSRPNYSVGSLRFITGYTVTGVILDVKKQPMVGVTVTIDGKSATTNGEGRYTVTGIQRSGSHTLVAKQGDIEMTRSFNIRSNQITYSMYTLYLVDAYIIYGGLITTENKPAVGIKVEVNGQTATTDETGKYEVMVSKTGTHTVTVKQSGYKETSKRVSVYDNSPQSNAGNLYAITNTEGYFIRGNVRLADTTISMSSVSVKVIKSDDSVVTTVTPDSEGYVNLKGITEAGSYTVIVSIDVEGYREYRTSFSISDTRPQASFGTVNFTPSLNMKLVTDSAKIEQGGTMTYTVKITNNGYAPAEKVILTSSPELPAGIFFISAKPIEPLLPNYNVPDNGGVANNCNITEETRVLECKYLGTLGGGKTAKVEVKVAFGLEKHGWEWWTTCSGGEGVKCGIGSHGSGEWWTKQPFTLGFSASGMTCKDCEITDDNFKLHTPPTIERVQVEPFLSLDMAQGKTWTEMGGQFEYSFTVSNSEKSPSAIKETKLDIIFPELVTLKNIKTTHGECKASTTGVLCNLDTLVNDSEAKVTLTLNAKSVGQGTVKVKLTSEQAPAIERESKTFTVKAPPPPPPPLPVGNADLMFVIDDTGSMAEELEAVQSAITEFINKHGSNTPDVGLFTFKDDVTNRIKNRDGGVASTQNMSWLLNGSRYVTGISQLVADYGDDCPEASLKALDEAKDFVKFDSRIVLITDASPHNDVDIDALIMALRGKGARVDVVLSGDECIGMCGTDSNADEDTRSALEVFSRIANETGGLFVAPFGVNNGTESGKKHYRQVVLNLLLGSVTPSVTAMTPDTLPQGATADITVNGANVSFNNKTTVSLGNNIKVNAVEVLSPTRLIANITVAEGAKVGFHDMQVSTVLSKEVTQVATGYGSLEVVAAYQEPQILGITPSSIERDSKATVAISAVNTNFDSSTKLDLGAGITVSELVAESPTSLLATIDISGSATLGAHPIKIEDAGQVLMPSCSTTKSPMIGSLLVNPSLEESDIPRIVNVTPSKGTQGATRRITIEAVNTHFEQDVTELRFNDEKIYILELEITSSTTANALIQIDGEAEIGLRNLFMYTDKEFASALDSFEITPKGEYIIEGCIVDVDNDPIAGVELDTGELLAYTDDTCYYKIEGVTEGEIKVNVTKEGYDFGEITVIVSENTAVNGKVVQYDIEAPSSALVVNTRPETWHIYQGENVTYIIDVINKGKKDATGIVVTDLLPANTTYVDAEVLSSGSCEYDKEKHQVICQAGDLDINASLRAKVTVRADGVVTLMNEVRAKAAQYPTSSDKTWVGIKPYLSVDIEDNIDPVSVQGSLTYTLTVQLSEYAADSDTAPNSTSGIELVSYLPNGVTLEEIRSEHAECNTDELPAITCQISDLSIESAESLSQVVITMRVTLNDAGLLYLIHNTFVSSADYPAHRTRERTKVNIGEGVVSAAIVLDITGSMGEELNATVKAIEQVIDADLADVPTIALITFKDEVIVRAATGNLSLLKDTLRGLEAEGGGTCPEASVEALDTVIAHVAEGGTIIFASDASPYDDADVDALVAKLKARNIKLVSIISGDCSNAANAWNDYGVEAAAGK
ncbi:carboxypeptidase regulatory-like domain-containing protein [Candidatus Albibeggiatoa sp. nov. NOAA]|uniref:carboxypeptidase regulatory-like domain-containing protein n=1 Tax=Candidatus Albibeggiatoa sp. nov. NOAA TaxID=3162724 RepID=UPI0033043495|nr:carboxypeptidase regulatory-like domain-containing protein [Thiotrichaceae bacterium]